MNPASARTPKTLILDLSEVLIRGLLGVEATLAQRVHASPESVLAALGGEPLETLCLGRISETEYWERVLGQTGWDLGQLDLRRAVRENFARPIPDMPEYVGELTEHFDLVLHSDHAEAWIADILPMHPFLTDAFGTMFFSYQIGALKSSSESFQRVLSRIGRQPGECLFVDDNPTNVATAISVGIPAVRFVGRDSLRELL